jgi:diphthamide biosynthesis enzyme Dph1/Dph2-like protein
MAGDSQVLLGRKFKKSNNKDKIFVYLGEFDEYAAPELQKFCQFIVPNLGSEDFSQVYYFSPMSNPSLNLYKKVAKDIMLRYANVDRIKDAEIIGILIGTVVCDNHMQIINALKRSILKSGKKFYEVLVGKINEPKLRNF